MSQQAAKKQPKEIYRLRSHVSRVLTEYQLGGTLIVAVSGGSDSSVLLDILCAIRGECKLIPIVAHVDHGLRASSADDAEFVAQCAGSYGIDFELHRASPPSNDSNIEAWARGVRYEFFQQLREKYGASAIVTAHHQQDQAETLLLRMLAGRLKSNARGMAGWDMERALLRPLLQISKAEVDQYLTASGVPFVEDPSNRDWRFTRNKIRHQLLPQLQQEYNPNLLDSLSSLGTRLADDERLLNQQAKDAIGELEKPLSSRDISQLPASLCWRVLRELASQQVGKPAELVGYDAFQRVVYCVNNQVDRPREVELGFGVCCRISGAGEISFFLGS